MQRLCLDVESGYASALGSILDRTGVGFTTMGKQTRITSSYGIQAIRKTTLFFFFSYKTGYLASL